VRENFAICGFYEAAFWEFFGSNLCENCRPQFGLVATTTMWFAAWSRHPKRPAIGTASDLLAAGWAG
jgi:hypothetical protein